MNAPAFTRPVMLDFSLEARRAVRPGDEVITNRGAARVLRSSGRGKFVVQHLETGESFTVGVRTGIHGAVIVLGGGA